MIEGKVYKLWKEGCDKCYICSTLSYYICIRLAHHRQAHRRGEKDYQGLFDGGDPKVEILEYIILEDKEDVSRLRKAEEKWMNQTDNCINVRRCYLTPEEKIKARNHCIKNYQKSPRGKLSMRKSYLNQKLKKLDSQILINEEFKNHIKKEIKFITDLQEDLRD